MTPERTQPSLAPIGDIGGTAGYAPIPKLSVTDAVKFDSGTDEAIDKAIGVAGKYLNDSRILGMLTDRVYELLLEDLRCQQERVRNYGNGR